MTLSSQEGAGLTASFCSLCYISAANKWTMIIRICDSVLKHFVLLWEKRHSTCRKQDLKDDNKMLLGEMMNHVF